MNIIRISDYKTYGCPSCNNKNNNVFLDKYDNNIHIICPKCGNDSLNYYGLGTEKLEEYVQKKCCK